MNDQTTNSIAVNASPLPEDFPGARCCHHTRKGRCRMPVSSAGFARFASFAASETYFDVRT